MPDRISDKEMGELMVLADIRAAVGDPNGKLMQDELVARCKQLQSIADWLESDGIRVKANALKDGWVCEDKGPWNATLLLDD